MTTTTETKAAPVAKAIIAGLSYESLSARLSTIAASEAITKRELGLLSRELLSFIVETSDVRIVNTLLGRGADGKLTLTVANRKAAGLFFQHFLPFSIDADSDVVQFAKKKGKVFDKAVEEIETFLADEANDLWSWVDANVKMEQKAIDYAGKITKDIKKALDADDGLTGAEVMAAVMEGGITTADLLQLVDAMMRQEQQAA